MKYNNFGEMSMKNFKGRLILGLMLVASTKSSVAADLSQYNSLKDYAQLDNRTFFQLANQREQEAKAKAQELYSNPLIAKEYNQVAAIKGAAINPYTVPGGKITYTERNVEDFLRSPEAKKANADSVKDLKVKLKERKDAFKKFDTITNDPRYLKMLNQLEDFHLNQGDLVKNFKTIEATQSTDFMVPIFEKNVQKNLLQLIAQHPQISQEEVSQIAQQLMQQENENFKQNYENYGTLKSLFPDYDPNWSSQDAETMALRKVAVQHANAQADLGLAKLNLRKAEVKGDYRTIRDLYLEDIPNAEKEAKVAEAGLYGSVGLAHRNKQMDQLGKAIDIAKVYPTWSPDVDSTMFATLEKQTKNQAKALDTANTWGRDFKYALMYSPSLRAAKYVGARGITKDEGSANWLRWISRGTQNLLQKYNPFKANERTRVAEYEKLEIENEYQQLESLNNQIDRLQLSDIQSSDEIFALEKKMNTLKAKSKNFKVKKAAYDALVKLNQLKEGQVVKPEVKVAPDPQGIEENPVVKRTNMHPFSLRNETKVTETEPKPEQAEDSEKNWGDWFSFFWNNSLMDKDLSTVSGEKLDTRKKELQSKNITPKIKEELDSLKALDMSDVSKKEKLLKKIHELKESEEKRAVELKKIEGEQKKRLIEKEKLQKQVAAIRLINQGK